MHQHALSRLHGVSVQPVVVVKEAPMPDRAAALKLSISLYCSEEKQVFGQHCPATLLRLNDARRQSRSAVIPSLRSGQALTAPDLMPHRGGQDDRAPTHAR
jgi:hypothetical protein